MYIKMKQSIAGAFHYCSQNGDGYPDGVTAGQIVEVDDRSGQRYCRPDGGIAEPATEAEYKAQKRAGWIL